MTSNISEIVKEFNKIASVPVMKVAAPQELTKPIDGDKAMEIYSNYLKFTQDTINFFSQKEKAAQRAGTADKRLDAAFMAAGGNPKQVVPGRVSKPSNQIHDEAASGDTSYEVVMRTLGLEQGGDVIQALMNAGQSFNWKRIARNILTMKNRAAAAKAAYQKA